MSQKVSITSPVGHIVMGSLYKPRTTDMDGHPLVIKNGPKAGQPRVDYFIALAIPKQASDNGHWANTEWGKQIWAVGHSAFPGIAQAPSFAWKIEDGDSAIPNTKGRKPCDNEGWKGHWILKLGSGFAPKIYQQENGAYVQVMTDNFIKPGYYVQVYFTVDGNESSQKPGIYLNHSMICFSAYGSEIVFGLDVNAVGFGQSALPAGASVTPLMATAPMPQAPGAAAVPPAPVVAPSTYAPPVVTPMAAPAVPPVTGVVPNTQFLNVPVPNAGQPMATPPAAPMIAVARQMTALATYTYEQYRAGGWTDVQLIQSGLMVA